MTTNAEIDQRRNESVARALAARGAAGAGGDKLVMLLIHWGERTFTRATRSARRRRAWRGRAPSAEHDEVPPVRDKLPAHDTYCRQVGGSGEKANEKRGNLDATTTASACGMISHY